jgi:cysteinyl-tRNA synthetase
VLAATPASEPSAGGLTEGDGAGAGRGRAGRAPTALHAEIHRLESEFDTAVAARDVEGAVNAILELDDTLVAWSGDTTQSDAGDRGRAAMRRMVARLGELARQGVRDPREVVGGFVESLIAERGAARAGRRYDDADRIRDGLVGLGIEVRDTPGGTEWELRDGQ